MELNMKPFMDFFWQLAAIVLTCFGSVALAFATKWIKNKAAQLRSQLDVDTQVKLDAIIEVGVAAAQQMKAAGLLPDGASAKQYALNYAQRELNARGVTWDVYALEGKMEALYSSAYGVDSINLLGVAKDAVTQAVAAYKESAASVEAKDAMVQFAEKYLKTYGMTVDADVLEGMILAQLESAVK
jgi:hypothetical protein